MTRQPSLLPLRATLVLVLSLLTAILAGGLSYLADQSLPAAVLIGGGAAGGALALFDKIIDRQM
ncbi:hypothetical protein [Virgisporangium aurantiacum]|uniref:Uncharacterized protein n=1 Tax=Virgisporangium aurantiacum TaxID=175570 RepID=A0A8J3ZJ21_9ACTN|nr:hypothetical protein [Virgisporangium aurantiacum]GIJ65012.1 hypothetical protein Vau01_125280 [Virgisporangium aurantiacum]